MNKNLLIILIFFSVTLVYASNFSEISQGDFNNGTYQNTSYNGAGVVLSGTNLTGTYTSRVFDASGISRWDNLTSNANLTSKEYLFTLDTTGAVFVSTDFGVGWAQQTSGYGGGAGVGSFFAGNNGYLYIVASGTQRKVWRSVNYGANWSIINDSFGSNLVLGNMDFNNNIFVVITGGQVLKSTDYGISWVYVGDFNGALTNGALGFAINSSNVLFITDASKSVYYSTNSGVNWSSATNDYGGTIATDDLVIDPNNYLYIMLNKQIFRSLNNGVGWSVINNSFTSYSNNGAKMFVDSAGGVYALDYLGRVFKSINNGVSWTEIGDFNGGSSSSTPKGGDYLSRTTNLSFQVRNCSSSDCSDGTWQDRNLGNINLTGRYFQYRTIFTSQDTSISPKLFNVSLNYLVLDDIPPTVSIISPLNNSYSIDSVLVNISSSDNSGISSIWFYNGSANVSYGSASYYLFPEGSNTIVAYANDTFNNMNSTTRIFYIDSVAPSITLALPESKTYGYNTSLQLNYSVYDSGTGVSSCWYNLNNGLNVSLSNCNNATFNANADGNYTLYIYSNDSLGNLANKNISFSVLTTAPAINLIFPKLNYLNYSQVYFNYSVNGVGVSYCELWGNWTGIWNLNQTNPSISTENNFFIANLGDGDYIWGITCNDSQNRQNSVNSSFSMDTTSPVLSLVQPTGIKTSRTGISLQFSIGDASPVYCWYNVKWSTGEYVITNTTLIGCNSTTFDVAADGNYIFNLYASDSANNKNSTNMSFSVDTSSLPSNPPTGTGGSSSSGGSSGGGAVIIRNTSTNQGSDLKVMDFGDLIVSPGEERVVELSVKNTGKTFLNKCKLSASPEYSGWIESSDIKNIGIGEIADFRLNLNVPEYASSTNSLSINIECVEKIFEAPLKIVLIKPEIEVLINKIKIDSDKNFVINYSYKGSSETKENIIFSVIDLKENKIAEEKEQISIKKIMTYSQKVINISNTNKGLLKVRVTKESDGSVLREESFLYNNALTGFASLYMGGTTGISIGLIVFGFIILATLIIRRMKRDAIKHYNLTFNGR